MNRRDILGSLAAWATAASAVAASEKTSIPTTVDGWPTKPLAVTPTKEQADRLRKALADDGLYAGNRGTAGLPLGLKVHNIPPEKTLLVFRLTQCLTTEMVEGVRDNIRSWVRHSKLDCAAVLLPYGLELEVHRVPVDSLSPDVSVSPKE